MGCSEQSETLPAGVCIYILLGTHHAAIAAMIVNEQHLNIVHSLCYERSKASLDMRFGIVYGNDERYFKHGVVWIPLVGQKYLKYRLDKNLSSIFCKKESNNRFFTMP
jgi:hypothetical protein